MSVIGIIYYTLHLIVIGNIPTTTSGTIIAAIYGLTLSIVGVAQTKNKKPESISPVIHRKQEEPQVFNPDKHIQY